MIFQTGRFSKNCPSIKREPAEVRERLQIAGCVAVGKEEMAPEQRVFEKKRKVGREEQVSNACVNKRFYIETGVFLFY